MGRQIRRHAVLMLVVAVYAGISFGINFVEPRGIVSGKFITIIGRFALLIPEMIFVVLVWRAVHLTYVQRYPARVGTILAEIKAFVTDQDRMLGGAIAAALMTVVLVSFAQLKNMIPVFNPFSWDQYFAELDRALHFGTLPHDYLHAVFGSDLVLSFFSSIYHAWLLLLYFVLVITCFLHPDNPHRMRYLLAFVLTWSVGGNLIATIFSSAGPVYFANLGLGDTYAGLMQLLQAHAATGAVTVVETQDMLWRWHAVTGSANAISAFPSMHVASSVLMAIFAFRWHRWAGIAMTVFALAMLIGSVLLAWHYAVDGYAGILIALAAWALAGWILRLTGAVPAAKAQEVAG